jgi:hypothetical protein
LVPALIAGPFASYDQLLDHIDEHFSFTTDDGAVGRMSVADDSSAFVGVVHLVATKYATWSWAAT